jgi:hypothetical protein
LARAKNTDRAEARRRYREQTRAEQDDDLIADADASDETVAAPQASGFSLRDAFRMPNIREDLRILPGMLLTTRKLWIPFVILLISFFAAVLLYGGALTGDLANIASLYVNLTLPPTALFVFFIGGFLAPRASYLVGAVLGLFDALLITLLLIAVPQAGTAGTASPELAIPLVSLWVTAVVVGVLAAGFAAWYRNFLRQSQERARQNRIAREQQAKVKAKEDARKTRDAQRQAAAAARQTSASPTSTPK